MRLRRILMVGFFLLLPIAAKAQATSGDCRVTLYSPHQLGVGPILVGRFTPKAGDGRTVKSYEVYPDMVVTAGVEFLLTPGRDKLIPWKMKLALSVSDKEEREVFDSFGSSEGSTRNFGRGWNLAVQQQVEVAEKTYIYTLECSETAKPEK